MRTPWACPAPPSCAASSRPWVEVGQEGAGADLDVEHQGGGALGDLLRHDRRGDQRDRLDGAGHVPQGVELAVGRGQLVGPAAQITAPTGASWSTMPRRLVERRPPAGDRPPSCRACRRCGPGPAPTAGARPPRRRPPAGTARGRPCRPRRRWSACRRWAGRAPDRSSRSPEAIMASVQVASSPVSSPRKTIGHEQGGGLLVGHPARRCRRRGTSGSARRLSRSPSRLARMTSTAVSGAWPLDGTVRPSRSGAGELGRPGWRPAGGGGCGRRARRRRRPATTAAAAEHPPDHAPGPADGLERAGDAGRAPVRPPRRRSSRRRSHVGLGQAVGGEVDGCQGVTTTVRRQPAVDPVRAPRAEAAVAVEDQHRPPSRPVPVDGAAPVPPGRLSARRWASCRGWPSCGGRWSSAWTSSST